MSDDAIWWLSTGGGIIVCMAVIVWRAAAKSGLLGWPEFPRHVQPPTAQVEQQKK